MPVKLIDVVFTSFSGLAVATDSLTQVLGKFDDFFFVWFKLKFKICL